MTQLPPPTRSDLRHLARIGGEVPPRAALVRAAWTCVRQWGDPEAAARLGAHAGALTPLEAERVVRLVRAADLASSTPARSGEEFVWRHPELLVDDGAEPDPPDAARPVRRGLLGRKRKRRG